VSQREWYIAVIWQRLIVCWLGIFFGIGDKFALLFVDSAEIEIIQNVSKSLFWNSLFLIPLALVNIIRFSIQGFGFGKNGDLCRSGGEWGGVLWGLVLKRHVLPVPQPGSWLICFSYQHIVTVSGSWIRS